MAFAEYIQQVKKVLLEATGGEDTATVTLESGTPYRHYLVWAHVAGGGTINVDVQPRFANADDGGVVNFAAAGTQKVFQVPIEEIRPATRLAQVPNNPFVMKSQLVITNAGAAPVQVTVYLIAAAAPGGA